MKSEKKFLSLFLSLAMVLSMAQGLSKPVWAETAVCKNMNTGSEYTDLKDAFSDATDNQIIRLLKNVSISEYVTCPGQITLDLNGFVLTQVNGYHNHAITNCGSLSLISSDNSTVHYYYYDNDYVWTLDDDAENKDSAITIGAINEDTVDGTLIKVTGAAIAGFSIFSEYGCVFNTSDQNMTISGVNIIANEANSNSSGIYNDGTLYIENSVIAGNKGVDGAGLYNGNSAKVTLSNVLIAHNISSNKGGGIYNTYGDIYAENTSIVSNAALCTDSEYGAGGAIYNNGGTINFAGGSISENSGNTFGGGIVNRIPASVTLSAVTMVGNTSKNGGGAIYNLGGKVVIEGGTVKDNKAVYNGGGIYNELRSGLTGVVTVSGVVITSNSSLNGGGIYNESVINIVNSTVSSNAAAGEGGGVFNTNTCMVSGLTFVNNNSGTGNLNNIYTYSKIYVWNLNPNSKIGISIDDDDGQEQITSEGSENEGLSGAFFADLEQQKVKLVNTGDNAYLLLYTPGICCIKRTGAEYSTIQAAVDAAEENDEIVLNDNAEISQTIIVSNDKNISIDLNGYVIDGSDISEPQNSGDNASVIRNEGTLSLVSSNNNTLHYYEYVKEGAWILSDGAVQENKDNAVGLEDVDLNTQEHTLVKITGSAVTGGKGYFEHIFFDETYGGGIYNLGNLTVSSVNVIGNKANYGGGIGSMDGGFLNYNGGTVAGNKGEYGSGIGNGGICTVSGVNFQSNYLMRSLMGYANGGGLFNSSKAYVDNCLFHGNYNDIRGYGLGIYNQSKMILVNSDIYENVSTESGVGIYNVGTLTASGCNIAGNIANSTDEQTNCGGGVYSYGYINLADSRIEDNKADLGGGIYFDECEADLSGLYITSNTAVSKGGAAYISEDCSVEFTDCNILYNKAELGGGVYNKGDFNVSGGSISSNTALCIGGGIDNEQSLKTVNAKIWYNKGESAGSASGGGIYNAEDAQAFVTGGSFIGNSAYKGGGAVNLGTISISNTEFKDNNAYYGGAIENDADLLIYSVDIENNTAGISGGGILNFGFVSLSGISKITNNAVNSGADNIYCVYVMSLNGEDLSYGSSIGISSENKASKTDPVYFTQTGTYTDTVKDFFAGDDSSCMVIISDSALALLVRDEPQNSGDGESSFFDYDAWYQSYLRTRYLVCLKDSNCVAAKYRDVVTNAWYHDGVHFCIDQGYMLGYDNGNFGPLDSISRAMVVTVIYRLEGSPYAGEESGFTDVEIGLWYSDAVAWAKNAGIVEGYGDGKFGPNDPITREQLVKIFYDYAKYKGYTSCLIAYTNTSFSDENIAHDWALDSIKWAKSLNIIDGRGDGSFDPLAGASRAEAATVILKFTKSVY